MKVQEDEIAVIIGSRIRELRLEKNYSQEKLAELSSLDMTYISMVERGKRNITVKSLLSICQALGIKLGEFSKSIDQQISLK